MLGLFTSLIAVVFVVAALLIELTPPDMQAQPFWNGLMLGLGLVSIPAGTVAALTAPLALYGNPRRLELIAVIFTAIYWLVFIVV
jgi:hypothetical protein